MIPFALGAWPEQSHRRIPGTVRPVEQPEPVSVVTQQYPNRFAKRASKMRHRTIGHDHEIKMSQGRGGVSKICKVWIEIDDWSTSWQRGQFADGRALLQTVQLHARQRASLEKAQQALSPPMIL